MKRDSYEPKMPVSVLSEADDKSLQQREASISGKRIKSSWRHLGSHPDLHRTGAPVCLIRVDSRRDVWADHPAAQGPPQTAQHRHAHRRRRRSLDDGQIKKTGSQEHGPHSLCLWPFLAFWSGSVRRRPSFFQLSKAGSLNWRASCLRSTSKILAAMKSEDRDSFGVKAPTCSCSIQALSHTYSGNLLSMLLLLVATQYS